MAKDGTMRGGARVGSGRKSKALTEKIDSGLAATVNDLPEPAEISGEDVPPVKDFLKAAQKSGIDLCAEDVFRSTFLWLKKKLSELKPYENNPRINDEAVDDVAESIKQCSYIAPIIIDEDGVILAGHTRYKALKKLGYKECEVVIVSDLTEEQKKKYRLYDNKTAEMASWDQKKLSAELCDVDFQGYDFGQPEMALPDEAEEDGPKMMTCPCCGEVFEV